MSPNLRPRGLHPSALLPAVFVLLLGVAVGLRSILLLISCILIGAAIGLRRNLGGWPALAAGAYCLWLFVPAAQPAAVGSIAIVFFWNAGRCSRTESLRIPAAALPSKYVMHLSLGAVFGLLGSVVMLAYFRTMRHSFVYGGVAHPKLALPIAVGAAIVNSFWEEHVWRNLPRLLLSESTSYIYLIVSAASFGIAHLSAWPHTLAFVALATLFGLISAYIVLTRQSLIPSFVAHVIVDVILLRYQIKS